MKVNWSASEIRIKLTPVGRPMGRKEMNATVFTDYGDSKIRSIQAIASKLGGEVVYMESSYNGVTKQVIPITSWRNTATNDYVAVVTEFIDAAFDKGMQVICYGAARAKWLLDITSSNARGDLIDNMSDKGLAGDGKAKAAEVIEANGIRVEF